MGYNEILTFPFISIGQKYDFLYFFKITFHRTDIGLKQYILTNKYYSYHAHLMFKTSIFHNHYISDIALFFHSYLYGLKLFSFEKSFQMCACFYYQRQVYIYPQNVRISLCPGTGAQWNRVRGVWIIALVKKR